MSWPFYQGYSVASLTAESFPISTSTPEFVGPPADAANDFVGPPESAKNPESDPNFVGPPESAKTTTTTKRSFNNPLGVDSFQELIKIIGDKLLIIAIPIAVIFIIWAGIRFVVSKGEKGEIDAAKKMLWYTIIGLAVIFIGKGFITLITDILNLSK